MSFKSAFVNILLQQTNGLALKGFANKACENINKYECSYIMWECYFDESSLGSNGFK